MPFSHPFFDAQGTLFSSTICKGFPEASALEPWWGRTHAEILYPKMDGEWKILLESVCFGGSPQIWDTSIYGHVQIVLFVGSFDGDSPTQGFRCVWTFLVGEVIINSWTIEFVVSEFQTSSGVISSVPCVVFYTNPRKDMNKYSLSYFIIIYHSLS